MKILLIEDDKEIRESLAELLRYQDYDVELAENGKEAFKLLRNSHPDLIITDVLMPEMDGYEVLMETRKQPEYKNIPILVVSAMAAPHQITTAKAFGAAGYLTKPFSATELFMEIEKLVESND